MKRLVVLFLCIILLCSCSTNGKKQSGKIKCNEYTSILSYDDNSKLIDVREKDEYDEYHIDNAINIPYTNIVDDIKLLDDITLDTPIIVYCRSGARSSKAYEALKNAGYKHVYDLGAMSSCD